MVYILTNVKHNPPIFITRNTIVFLMICAISLSLIGDIYSEKPLVNGLLLLASFGCAVGVIVSNAECE